jgi:tetratricopeptide (TPR) repeat protein
MKFKYIALIALFTLGFLGCADKNEKLFKQAFALDKQGKTEQSLALYNAVLRAAPQYPPALVNRAIAYEKLGESAKAQADYLKAYKLYPNNPEILNNMGAFFLSQKKPFTALFYLNKALEINPDYFLAYMNRASANEYLGRFIAAGEDLKSALQISPDDLQALTNKAVIDYKRFNYKSAAEGFSKAIILDPSNARNYYLRAMTFRTWNRYVADALEDLNQAIRLDSSYVDALYARAQMLFKLGEYQDALGDLEKIKTVNNEYIPAYELTGDIIAIEDPIAAAANYITAKKLDKNAANRKRYDAKIRLMASEDGRKRVIANAFNKGK